MTWSDSLTVNHSNETPGSSATRSPSHTSTPASGQAIVIANTRSGQDGKLTGRLLEHVAKRLKAMEFELAGIPWQQGDIAAQLDAASGTFADLVIAVGGDGTGNAAASLAIRHNARMAVVPTGTLNLVANDL
ncbi:MAG: NAD(+)/NADH kinase, partial [Salinibacterium sp.]|nr:NAD(+)/NADH kinase [Salinibacterium sp.]